MENTTTITITIEAEATVKNYEKMSHEAYWKLLLARNSKGQNLHGLLRATCIKCDRKHKILATCPEAYGSIEDLLSYGLAYIYNHDIVERFEAEKAGGSQNFSGYLAARLTGALRNSAQDVRRARSIDLRGYETHEMEEKGEAYGQYTPADHCDLEIKSSTDMEDREMNYRGSQSQDWCARCDWAVSEPVSPEQSEVFLKNILWELSQEEADLAKGILTHGTLNEAARAQGVDKAHARNLMLQARKRLNRLGISPDLMKKGLMI